jgi:hypothetical protein
VTLLEYMNAGHGVGVLLPYDPIYLPTGGTIDADVAMQDLTPTNGAFMPRIRSSCTGS